MKNNSQPSPQRALAEHRWLDKLASDYRRRRAAIEIRHFAVLAAILVVAAVAMAHRLGGIPAAQPYGQYSSTVQLVNDLIAQI